MRQGSAKDTARWIISGAVYSNRVTEPFRVSADPLDPDALAAIIACVAGPENGAIATFVGTVRLINAGRRVLWLDYEAYTPLAVRSFERIAQEAAEHWPNSQLAIHHRTGRLFIGEPSVLIAAGSPHRADAFSAARYAIERVKQIAPIWKHEHFEGGEVWVEGATADPFDDGARQQAFERACS